MADNPSISPNQTTRGREVTEHGLRSDSRLGRIIRILADNATVVVSGTKLAHEIDTNRSEVWRLVQQLRAFGVEITGHPATGYQLASVPDLLLPEALEPLVKGTMFAREINHYFRVGSTNAEGMQAAANGASEGSVFIAEEQTAGRGRAGHTWVSEPSSGIYVSVILRPQFAPADALLLSLIAGIAAHDAVVEVTGLRPDIRWPNDLLIGNRKFCGILTEMNAEVTRVRYAVVGIGVNVNQLSFPMELAENRDFAAACCRAIMVTGSDNSGVTQGLRFRIQAARFAGYRRGTSRDLRALRTAIVVRSRQARTRR